MVERNRNLRTLMDEKRGEGKKFVDVDGKQVVAYPNQGK